MANPQIEDGHTKIANEIMDALMRTNFSAYDRRILDCIFRKTYGWNKKSDRISYSQYEEATGMKRWHIARAIKRLVERQIIIITGEGQALEYSIQKDFEKWKPLPKEVIDTITQTGNEPLPKEVTVTADKPLPIQEKPLPIQEKPLPIQVTKPLPKQVNTKAIKHLQKHITKASNNGFVLPEWIKKEIFDAFLEMRKTQKAPMTDYAVKLLIKKLEDFRTTGEDANEILNQSIMRSWKGVFTLKDAKENFRQKKGDYDGKAIPGNRPAGAFADLV